MCLSIPLPPSVPRPVFVGPLPRGSPVLGVPSPTRRFPLVGAVKLHFFPAHLDVEQKMPQPTKQEAKFDDILKMLTLTA